jgi:hypothetical protein
MRKALNQTVIANELKGNSAFFPGRRKESALDIPTPELAPAAEPQVIPPTSQSIDRLVSQSTGPSIDQSIDQPDGQMVAPSSGEFDNSPVLGRPKAFYLTERQDRDLDTAVVKLTERLRGRGNQKIDRSTVMRLLLEASDVTDDRTIERLASQLISRLVSQLTG